MWLQIENEFQHVKLKNLNDRYNVEMFLTTVKGWKAFEVEQKIRKLISRIAKLSALKIKVPPKTIIFQSAENMDNVKSERYGVSPNEIEQRLLLSEKFNMLVNFHRIE